AKQGRIFVLRLEHEEILHEIIEKFAQEKGIQRAVVWAVGGADDGSQLVVSVRKDRHIFINVFCY
ncbi:MAG: DUF296 domain-containing protein, partial [Dissulfuribacterales bacterium]